VARFLNGLVAVLFASTWAGSAASRHLTQVRGWVASFGYCTRAKLKINKQNKLEQKLNKILNKKSEFIICNCLRKTCGSDETHYPWDQMHQHQ